MENRYLCRAKRLNSSGWIEGVPAEWCGSVEVIDKECMLHRVDPSTVCLCTGYEGIYEKDIFRYEGENYIVTRSDDSLRWEAVSLYTNVSVPLADLYPDYMVLIGNEIDNPELLEG